MLLLLEIAIDFGVAYIRFAAASSQSFDGLRCEGADGECRIVNYLSLEAVLKVSLCQPLEHQPGHCQIDEGFTALRQSLVIF